MRQLFDIEDLYRQSSDQERLAGRREKSQPIVEALHDWLQQGKRPVGAYERKAAGGGGLVLFGGVP